VNHFTFPAHANCAPQFIGLEIQCTTPETIDSHIKLLMNNSIIFNANKHILPSPLFRKPVKKLLQKITLQPGFEPGSLKQSVRAFTNY